MRGRRILPASIGAQLQWLTLATFVWVATWAIVVAGQRQPPGWVQAVDRLFFGLGNPLRRIAQELVRLGDHGPFLIIVVILLGVCAVRKSPAAFLLCAISLAAQQLLVEDVLKPIVGSHFGPGPLYSYPSGTTATAACLGTLLILLLGQAGGPLRLRLPRPLHQACWVIGAALGPAVGISVVITGAHDVVDALAAVPLGVNLTLLVAAGIDWFQARLHRARHSEAPRELESA